MEGRPVKFTCLTKSYPQEWRDGEGTFIKWGSGYTDYLGKPMQITFAVVEGQDGQVYRINEDKLKFTDKNESNP